MQLVIVTGLAGSGKSTGLRALEDAGWFCMDNLPVPLLPPLLELMAGQQAHQRVAVAIDARDVDHIGSAGQVLDAFREHGIDLRIVFFDTREDEILRRFKETRRRHPLSRDGDVRKGVELERSLLDGLRERADVRIDTSTLTVHDLKKLVLDHFADAQDRQLLVRCLSFGFKHGVPQEADLVFDVRFLRNPHFVPALRDQTGLDPAVATFVEDLEDARTFLQHTMTMLEFLLPRYAAEGKVYLTIAIGCTGGQHRSVALAEMLTRRLSALGHETRAEHREHARWPKPAPT